MKVAMEKDYKRFYTIEDAEIAKKIIKWEKEEDTETVAGWAEYAAREALSGTNDYMSEIITASARTAMNYRAWDHFFEGSKNLDVWIEALVRTSYGFIEIGAYLTDIWQSGAEAYKHHMYIQRYKRVETA